MYLARLCYGRSLWFPFFREPLVLGMKLLGRLHGINYLATEGPNKECKGCLRHLKNRLKEKSPAFVFLNNLVNPVFNRLRDSLLDQEEKHMAKTFASGNCILPFTAGPLPWRGVRKRAPR
ncbi:MAG: nitroreductase [Elusimicrobia bacterium]|nr:nitroreductase [Elusimicrobiota bacterium]